MKNLLLTVSTLALGVCFVSEAMADCNGPYIGFRGGATKHKYDDKYDDFDYVNKWKTMLSAALGYRYDYFRIEGEYIWRDKSEKKETTVSNANEYSSKDTFKSYSLMANLYFDFLPYRAFSPYVSAGIGMTKLKYADKYTDPDGTSSSYTSDSDRNYKPNNFTWSVGAGATLKVTSRFNIDAGYRYYDMGSIGESDITAHEIYGGIRYVF